MNYTGFVINRKILACLCLMLILSFGQISALSATTSATASTTKITGDPAATATEAFPDYALYVNRDQNVTLVYKIDALGNEVLYKSFACSCGRTGHATPKGSFKVDKYYNWRLMVDGTYGRFCTRFNNNIMFHSVPYYTASADNLEYEEYNLLGANASLGCIRLALKDARWIYENCKLGTKVVVYSNEEDPTVLIKPTTTKIPVDSPYRGWDPTDTYALNPWLEEGNAEALKKYNELVAKGDISLTGNQLVLPESSSPSPTPISLTGENFSVNSNASNTPKASATPVVNAQDKTKSTNGSNNGTNYETIANFDYVTYADMYADLKAAFGYDRLKLYSHYIIYGKKEGRVAYF